MIVKRFGCTTIYNKAIYKCIIHSRKKIIIKVLGYYRNPGSLRYGTEYTVEKSTLSMGKNFFPLQLKPISITQL